MDSKRLTQFIQTSMSENDIEQALKAHGYGVISLCEDGEPYSIPVSFGFDGECIYFPFLVSGDSTKTEYIGEGQRVRFLVTEVQNLYDWQSVSVSGCVEAIDPDSDEWDHFITILVEQDWFDPQFEDAASIDTIEGWKLDLDDAAGMERRPFSHT